MPIRLKRAYDQPADDDGMRILVDRLWPRGLTKDRARVDLWLKEISPSAELRKWFAHDAEKWRRFRGRYQTELRRHPNEIATLERAIEDGCVTLLFRARDEKHNEAVVLKHFLEKRARRRVFAVELPAIHCASSPCSLPEIED